MSNTGKATNVSKEATLHTKALAVKLMADELGKSTPDGSMLATIMLSSISTSVGVHPSSKEPFERTMDAIYAQQAELESLREFAAMTKEIVRRAIAGAASNDETKARSIIGDLIDMCRHFDAVVSDEPAPGAEEKPQ